MSKTYKDSPTRKAARKARERRLSVRAVRRDPPDLRKLSRALIQLALAEAAAEAGATEAHTATATTDRSTTEQEADDQSAATRSAVAPSGDKDRQDRHD